MSTLKQDQEQVIQELGELETEIRNIIEKVYDCCFAGKIVIIPLPILGWQVKFSIPQLEKPVSLAAELPKDKFLKYIEEELRFGAWSMVHKYRLELNYPDDPMNHKDGSSCNGNCRLS